MKDIAISEFKAKCTALLEEVARTQEPIRITRHGKPIAKVIPETAVMGRAAFMGSLRGTVEILGDIISPVIDEDEFEALRD
jgi:prevent-host-death family protein